MHFLFEIVQTVFEVRLKHVRGLIHIISIPLTVLVFLERYDTLIIVNVLSYLEVTIRLLLVSIRRLF